MGGEPDIYYIVIHVKFAGVGFPGGSVVKNPSVNGSDVRDTGSVPGREDPPETGMATHSVFLPGEPHRQRSPVGYGP